MANNLEGIHMPELIIYEFLKTCQKIVAEDWAATLNKDETLLALLFKKDRDGKDIKWESYNYFDQAVRIIVKDGYNVNLGYNSETSDMVAVHILLPTENSDATGIGGNENYQGYIETETAGHSEIFSQRFDTSYNLLISSKNAMEVIVTYHFLKACFLSMHANLELYGFQNLKMSGSDVTMQTDLVPTQIYHRSLTLAFGYEMIIPNLYKQKLAKSFKLTGIILPLNEQ